MSRPRKLSLTPAQKKQYRLSEAQAEQDLTEWQQGGAGLERELAVARSMLQDAINTNQPGLAANLLTILSRLERDHVTIQRQRSELLERAEVHKLMERMADAVIIVLRQRFSIDESNGIADEIIDRWRETARHCQNPEHVKGLPGPEGDE